MWFVAMTKYGDERIAERNLMQQGIEVYNPQTWRYRNKQQTMELACLFPTYLFFKANPGQDDFHPIKHTKGIRKLIQFGPEPARVPESIIDYLMEQESKEGVHLIPGADYEIGDAVRITDGRFKLYEAVIRAKPRDRLEVLLHGMGRDIKLILDYGQVEPA